jgi:hypothetical protein
VALVCRSITNLVGNKRIKHISLGPRLWNIDVWIEKIGRSPALKMTHLLLMFIYPKVTTWDVPKGYLVLKTTDHADSLIQSIPFVNGYYLFYLRICFLPTFRSFGYELDRLWTDKLPLILSFSASHLPLYIEAFSQLVIHSRIPKIDPSSLFSLFSLHLKYSLLFVVSEIQSGIAVPL